MEQGIISNTSTSLEIDANNEINVKLNPSTNNYIKPTPNGLMVDFGSGGIKASDVLLSYLI